MNGLCKTCKSNREFLISELAQHSVDGRGLPLKNLIELLTAIEKSLVIREMESVIRKIELENSMIEKYCQNCVYSPLEMDDEPCNSCALGGMEDDNTLKFKAKV
jgi:hypothetical protein